MDAIKALVLCAGRGTRLRPLTHTRAKAALPVAGRPVLQHILSYLRAHGFTQVGVVISPGQPELRHLLERESDQDVRFIVQRRPKGIAHAVAAAERFLDGDPFLLYLGDNLTDEPLGPVIERFQREQPDALLLVRQVPNPEAFGVAETEGERVLRVWEKPSHPPSDLAIAGIYLFSSAVHAAIRSLRPSSRGEYEITDAIAALLSEGRQVLFHQMSGWWQDMGSMKGIIAANARLLDQVETEVDSTAVLDSVEIQGRVIIGPGSVLQRVRLRGPLVIGPGCRLLDSYVGPYTSLGEAVNMERTSIENSILLNGCRLEGPPFHLEDCLLGSGTEIEMSKGRAGSLQVGDYARLILPQDRA